MTAALDNSQRSSRHRYTDNAARNMAGYTTKLINVKPAPTACAGWGTHRRTQNALSAWCYVCVQRHARHTNVVRESDAPQKQVTTAV